MLCSVSQFFLTLSNSMDCSPPGSSDQGIHQARILEQVAISSSGDLPNPGIKLIAFALAGGFFTTVPPGKPLDSFSSPEKYSKSQKFQSLTLLSIPSPRWHLSFGEEIFLNLSRRGRGTF